MTSRLIFIRVSLCGTAAECDERVARAADSRFHGPDTHPQHAGHLRVRQAPDGVQQQRSPVAARDITQAGTHQSQRRSMNCVFVGTRVVVDEYVLERPQPARGALLIPIQVPGDGEQIRANARLSNTVAGCPGPHEGVRGQVIGSGRVAAEKQRETVHVPVVALVDLPEGVVHQALLRNTRPRRRGYVGRLRVWAATAANSDLRRPYSRLSVSACRLASMMFSWTPIVVHVDRPSVLSMSTRVTAAVPDAELTMRTL